MSINLMFWVVMLIWLVLGFYTQRSAWPTNVGLFILLALLGWQVFGAAVHK